MENRRSNREYDIKKDNVLIEWARNAFSWKKEEQRNSIAYKVIRISFFIGIFLSIIVAINSWCFVNPEYKVPNIKNDLRDIWNIVIPIITFAIGHIFGKHSE